MDSSLSLYDSRDMWTVENSQEHDKDKRKSRQRQEPTGGNGGNAEHTGSFHFPQCHRGPLAPLEMICTQLNCSAESCRLIQGEQAWPE